MYAALGRFRAVKGVCGGVGPKEAISLKTLSRTFPVRTGPFDEVGIVWNRVSPNGNNLLDLGPPIFGRAHRDPQLLRHLDLAAGDVVAEEKERECDAIDLDMIDPVAFAGDPAPWW